ncbi:hypothetical protein [Rufibacter roseus]|uniref:TerB-C domain-containing protein n=2 Tax=Rufibacter roseus TaxID=1567108 RepID=A0ABW2DLZ5_9BACT|nr:hypothetical protein [Rufibacter roseus]
MKDKYNQTKLGQYSQELAQRLSQDHYLQHETVTAQQLISFTPVKQVNLYMIRELLTLWNHEMANLRSPYFDFEHPEVKDALVQFMNVLSRKISIRRPHFEPLLLKAIQDTFRATLDPVAVFEEKFLRLDELSVAKLHETLKYQDIDKDLYRRFLDTLSDDSLERTSITSRLEQFLQLNEQERTSLEELVSRFNELQPVTAAELLPQPTVIAPAPAEPTPAPALATPPVTPPATYGSNGSAVSSTESAPFFRPVISNEPKLNERFQTEQKPTLNERLKQPANASLADRQQDQKIGSLRDAISINQRFSFINELFDGDNMSYHEAIKTLDTFDSADAAKNYLLQEVGSKYNWARKEDHVQKLTKLIERKYA